jgi:hypothetical protein
METVERREEDRGYQNESANYLYFKMKSKK